jgi:hypothetical protein
MLDAIDIRQGGSDQDPAFTRHYLSVRSFPLRQTDSVAEAEHVLSRDGIIETSFRREECQKLQE